MTDIYLSNKPEEYNVLFLTLDSCTFESATRANTPNLNKISKLRKAETHATYTFPAHHAFFIGNLPRIISSKNTSYFDQYQQIWRSGAARKKVNSQQIAIQFEGSNIIEYYKKRNYTVIGCGGVSFFNKYNPSNGLPKLFPSFLYFDSSKYVPREKRIPREPKSFPLNNINKILNKITPNKPYFLFINCPETHIPYDCPDSVLKRDYKDLIIKLYREHDNKRKYSLKHLPFSKKEIDLVKSTQVKSLEWIDKQFGNLVEKLPHNERKTMIIVCADHGDEFGEGGKFGHFHNHRTVFTVPLWTGII